MQQAADWCNGFKARHPVTMNAEPGQHRNLGIYQPVFIPPKLVQVDLSIPVAVQQVDHALRIIRPDGVAQLSAAGRAAFHLAEQDVLLAGRSERSLDCCSAAHVPVKL